MGQDKGGLSLSSISQRGEVDGSPGVQAQWSMGSVQKKGLPFPLPGARATGTTGGPALSFLGGLRGVSVLVENWVDVLWHRSWSLLDRVSWIPFPPWLWVPRALWAPWAPWARCGSLPHSHLLCRGGSVLHPGSVRLILRKRTGGKGNFHLL